MQTTARKLNSEELLAFANELADAARVTTLRYFRQPLSVEHKADASPVTIADRRTEQQLRELISARFPDHGLYGEEYGSDRQGGGYRWVIDPIDGTKSFISGVPTFGTLLALLCDDCPVLGIIDMPALGERWSGTRGQTTTFQGLPCRCRDCPDLTSAVLFTTSPDMFTAADATRFAALSDNVGLRRFGGDCYAYGLLASGFIDLVVEADLKPYDFMAMVPIIEGAGGMITDWQGMPLGLDSDGRVLAAGSATLHAAARAILSAA